MTTKIESLKNRVSLLALLAVLSCESYNGALVEPENQVTFSQTEYYIVPGSSIVIDLESVIKQSFATASLKISQNPYRGELSQVGALLLKYRPGREFIEGRDQFVFSVISNGEIIATERMTILAKQNIDEFPCDLYTVEDRARVKSGSSVSVQFLKNDRLCGIGSPLQITIQSEPAFGESKLIGDSIITYTPGPEYMGRDQVVYKLNDASGENVSFGIVSLTDQWIAHILPLPDDDPTEISFVNENTGFLGGRGIYRTTDAGLTWNVSYHDPADKDLNITEFFFQDADNGFATYSSCPDRLEDCKGGLLRTTDGGTTWEPIEFEHSVTTVFFTSPSIGFVGITEHTYDSQQKQAIFKTEDGGATWKQVFTVPLVYGPLKIRFTDLITGYAHNDYTMFRTTDGGETWKWAIDAEYITDVSVISGNVVTVSFAEESFTTPTLSTMLKSQDGVDWRNAGNFEYELFTHGFSPTANVGFAVGISGTYPPVHPLSQTLSINRSLDKGASWKEDDITEPLNGFPLAMAIPSDNVSYILCADKIIKYTSP